MNKIVTTSLAAFTLTLGITWAACTTDQPKVDGGSAALAAEGASSPGDAGTGVSDAGTNAAFADAGMSNQPQDGGTASTDATDIKPTDVKPDGAKPDDTKPDDTKNAEVSPFDRILAKPKAQPFDVDALKALVEKKTGLKITKARKSAGKWVLFEFAPTSGGRGEQDQAKLVATLQEMGEFTNVEGDKLMKVKTP